MLAVNIILAFAWLVLTGEFTPANFAIGFGLGYFMLFWVDKSTPQDSSMSRYLKRAPKVVLFVIYFLWSIVVANFRMAKAVVRSLFTLEHIQPAIVAIPLDLRSSAEITLLANWITLTPGTLTLEIAEDNSTIYVHTFQCPDVEAFRAEIKHDFERRIMEINR